MRINAMHNAEKVDVSCIWKKNPFGVRFLEVKYFWTNHRTEICFTVINNGKLMSSYQVCLGQWLSCASESAADEQRVPIVMAGSAVGR